MNYTKRSTKPVVLASVFVLFCLSIWVLSAPSVRAQNYVVIYDGPIAQDPSCTQPVILAGQCPPSQDNPGTIKLEYRLRLTQTSANPGEQTGLLLDLAVEWHYSCPTQTMSCELVQNVITMFMDMLSGRSVPPPEGNGPELPPVMAFSIDTGGLTTQPLIVQADWVQILGLGSTIPQDYKSTGTATTYLTIPAGISPGAYQLQATLRTTPSVITTEGYTGNDVASFSWPPTEPVQLIVGAGQAATTATGQNTGETAPGQSTPVGLTILTPDAGTNAAEGAVAATVGGLASVGVAAALSQIRKPGEVPTEEPTPDGVGGSETEMNPLEAIQGVILHPGVPLPPEVQGGFSAAAADMGIAWPDRAPTLQDLLDAVHTVTDAWHAGSAWGGEADRLAGEKTPPEQPGQETTISDSWNTLMKWLHQGQKATSASADAERAKAVQDTDLLGKNAPYGSQNAVNLQEHLPGGINQDNIGDIMATAINEGRVEGGQTGMRVWGVGANVGPGAAEAATAENINEPVLDGPVPAIVGSPPKDGLAAWRAGKVVAEGATDHAKVDLTNPADGIVNRLVVKSEPAHKALEEFRAAHDGADPDPKNADHCSEYFGYFSKYYVPPSSPPTQ